jgi:hypothetical protein
MRGGKIHETQRSKGEGKKRKGMEIKNIKVMMELQM